MAYRGGVLTARSSLLESGSTERTVGQIIVQSKGPVRAQCHKTRKYRTGVHAIDGASMEMVNLFRRALLGVHLVNVSTGVLDVVLR